MEEKMAGNKEFDTLVKSIESKITGYRPSQMTESFNVLSQSWDDSKKIECAKYIFTTDFEYPENLLNYRILNAIFKKTIKMSENDVVDFCLQYKKHFELFDASGIKFFVKQVVGAFPKKESKKVISELEKLLTEIKNANIRFEEQRAKTKNETMEIIEKYIG